MFESSGPDAIDRFVDISRDSLTESMQRFCVTVEKVDDSDAGFLVPTFCSGLGFFDKLRRGNPVRPIVLVVSDVLHFRFFSGLRIDAYGGDLYGFTVQSFYLIL